MWFALIFGLGAIAVYEFTKLGKARGSCATGTPAPCCTAACCAQCAPACDGTGSETIFCCCACEASAIDCAGCQGAAVSCCCQITNDPATWPSGDKIWDVCQAIAIAEGANGAGSAPDRYNNPGDLSQGDEHGQEVTEYVTLGCGETEIHFATKRGGWNALYAKISRVVLGKSTVYSRDMTWQQFAQKYAGNSSAWASNVTKQLGVSPTDTFGSYFS